MSPIKFATKRIFPTFHILKIDRMKSFCNLFMKIMILVPLYIISPGSIVLVTIAAGVPNTLTFTTFPVTV